MTTETIQKINAYLEKNGSASWRDIANAAGISRYALTKLHEAGLVQLPKPMNASQAATYGRKKTGTGSKFYINRPAPWQA